MRRAKLYLVTVLVVFSAVGVGWIVAAVYNVPR